MVSIPAELNAAGALEEQHQSDNSIVYSGELDEQPCVLIFRIMAQNMNAL